MTEPEEIIEASIVALVAANSTIPVFGMLTPSADGTEKTAPDTSIDVAADVSAQSFDSRIPNVPFTFSVRITVRAAGADDATGNTFRTACRGVRGTIAAILGDGCTAVSADGFTCDGVILENTTTGTDADAKNGGWYKIYSLSVTGRYTEPAPTTESLELGA